jgi:hypothetical protein
LLFAVPVVAPYGALSGPNYKYKVKLTPGQGKKGKTAMQVRGDERKAGEGVV